MAYRLDDRGDIVMSKYYKEEDIIKAIESADTFTMWQEQFAINTLKSLPTIEVEEDCISRADLIESFLADSECKREEAKACMCSIDFMLELIEDAPSVVPKQSKLTEAYTRGYKDGAEQSREEGEWLEIDDGHVLCKCSICKEEYLLYEEHVLGRNYCPNCGAKMCLE